MRGNNYQLHIIVILKALTAIPQHSYSITAILPLCSPVIESTALPPLSEPALPPCSAGDVRSVEPSVAAVLPSSSLAAAVHREHTYM